MNLTEIVKNAEIAAEQTKQYAKEAQLQAEIAALTFQEIKSLVKHKLGSLEDLLSTLDQYRG
jgi:hypothetical protein